MTMRGLIEKSTGDLLSCGCVDFTTHIDYDPNLHEIVYDLPSNPLPKNVRVNKNIHSYINGRWEFKEIYRENKLGGFLTFSFDNSKPIKKVRDNNWELVGTIHYPGSRKVGTIKLVRLVAYKDWKIDSAYLRIYDSKNNVIVVNVTINNNQMDEIVKDNILYFPYEKSLLEIQCLSAKNSNLYLSNLTIEW